MVFQLWTIKDITDTIDWSLQNNFDFILVIEGKTGLGKSTLGLKIAMRCSGRDIYFDMDNCLVYSKEDVIGLLSKRKKSVLFADELINVTYNRDFYNNLQKTLIKGLNMYRDSNNVFIGCVPKFIDLDKQMQRLVKMKITIISRGIGLIHTQKKVIYDDDVWDIAQNKKLEQKYTRSSKLNTFAKTSTCIGYVKFNDLQAETKERYLAIKSEKRGKIFNEEGDIFSSTDYKTQFFGNIYTSLINHQITREEFLKACELNNVKYNTMRGKIYTQLQKDNSAHNITELFKIAQEKRDTALSKQKQKQKDKKKIRIEYVKKTKPTGEESSTESEHSQEGSSNGEAIEEGKPNGSNPEESRTKDAQIPIISLLDL